MMNKLKECKISMVLFGISIVLLCVSAVTGLIPELNYSIDKICMYLGFAFFGLGFAFLEKSKMNK